MKRFEHYACLSPKATSTNADIHKKIKEKLNNNNNIYIYACCVDHLSPRQIEIVATGYCYEKNISWNI
ncbi:MAG: hypothetical protein ACK5N8_08530 [Alphaproteobacteria bacterium]